MDITRYIWYFALICVTLLCSSVFAQDVCVKRTPCRCVFPNGTGFDLTDSAKPSFFSAQIYVVHNESKNIDLVTYYYHPCFDALPTTLNASSIIGGCGTPLSACRREDKMTLLPPNPKATVPNATLYEYKQGPYEFMGTSNLTEFASDGQTIIYEMGPSNTVVKLVCAATDDRLEIFSLFDPQNPVLAFYSRNSCLQHLESSGRSTGSTLLIIFFSVVTFYLVLGVCTKKFLMGAQGIEVIPNLGFWSDLPNLVKDGWAFTLNGFKLPARGGGPVTSPDPNGYDSI